ncbi:hypothetical protein BH09BAC2_BH09BAC2_08670 [soil metagenome]
MFYLSQLQTAINLIRTYKGNEPFHTFLKKYFAANKKHGSKDRKNISSLCYNYFRLGKAASKLSIQEAVLSGTFLCENKSHSLLEALKPEWNLFIADSIESKMGILKNEFKLWDIFPFDELTGGIHHEKYAASILIQPKVFIRIRPEKKQIVLQKLASADIAFQEISENCIAFESRVKVDSVLQLDKDAVVQDLNSQKTGRLMQIVKPGWKVWDCCAASGGKAVMIKDIEPNIDMTVSDKRASILLNLNERFKTAGIKNYRTFVADLEKENATLPDEKYDLILADMPCTGSGTWARTPEQLFYFNKNSIKKYSDLQIKIAQKVIPFLKTGGYFLYITCSVFKQENEMIIDVLKNQFQLKVIESNLFAGYESKADTLFAALLTSPTA